jgi:hypothetical protein
MAYDRQINMVSSVRMFWYKFNGFLYAQNMMLLTMFFPPPKSWR